LNHETVISVRHLTKTYRIWDSPASRLSVPLWQSLGSLLPGRGLLQRGIQARAHRGYRDFCALQDVSFEVHRGECLGIVGRNGAGKSTLLQLITGTLRPTTGTVDVRGRVAALLELGSGFNPDFTGRENVFLNASILGLTQQQIEARYDDILRFAEIGDFIDEPVKVYSSGMTVRLAFAVIAHVDADVLIIDEALAVGDARFQLKCARAIDRFIERGVTLLFVSHDTGMVKRLCNRAMLIEHGRSIFTGAPNKVVNLYSKLLADGGSLEALAPDLEALQRAPAETPVPAKEPAPTDEPPAPAMTSVDVPAEESVPLPPEAVVRSARMLADERAHVQVSGHEYAYGGELGRIRPPRLAGADGTVRDWFTSGEQVTLHMEVEAFESMAEPIYALTVKDRRGQEVYGTNTLFSKQPAPAIAAGGRQVVEFRFPMNLIQGTYFISLGWTQFVGEELVVVHRRYDVIKLDVHGVDNAFGIANLWARINVDTAP